MINPGGDVTCSQQLAVADPDAPPIRASERAGRGGSRSCKDASGDPAARVDFPAKDDQRIDLAVAVSWADRVERDDKADPAEMNPWLRYPDVHAMTDSVPVEAIPHVPAGQPRQTDAPLRDFKIGSPTGS
jgi:hypothetical protein